MWRQTHICVIPESEMRRRWSEEKTQQTKHTHTHARRQRWKTKRNCTIRKNFTYRAKYSESCTPRVCARDSGRQTKKLKIIRNRSSASLFGKSGDKNRHSDLYYNSQWSLCLFAQATCRRLTLLLCPGAAIARETRKLLCIAICGGLILFVNCLCIAGSEPLTLTVNPFSAFVIKFFEWFPLGHVNRTSDATTMKKRRSRKERKKYRSK